MSVEIRRWTGDAGTPSQTVINDINSRMNAEDAHSVAGTDNAILVPEAGSTHYSYKCATRLYYNGAGTGTIDNLEWFTDGTNNLGTGLGLQARTAETYTQAAGTEGETGNEMTGGADAFSYATATPLAVTGTITDPNNADIGHFVELQLTADSTAGAGAATAETMYFRYDSTIA